MHMRLRLCMLRMHTRECIIPGIQRLTPGSFAGGHLTHLGVHLWGTYSTHSSLLLERKASKAERGRVAGS